MVGEGNSEYFGANSVMIKIMVRFNLREVLPGSRLDKSLLSLSIMKIHTHS